MQTRVAILASGRGSNLQVLIDSVEKGDIPAEIALVISDNPKAQALERAQKHKIPALIVARGDFATRELFEKEILKIIEDYNCNIICLAGFMRILSPYFILNSKAKIINIHPSLLPSFPGLEAQKQALDYGVKFSGCTVHFVDEGMDTGPIILQGVVPVLPDDTEETLVQRILIEEHRIYPEALKLLAQGQVKIQGRKTILES